MLQVVQHTRNLSSPAVRGARRQWPLANQQDGAAHTGLLSLVATREAQDSSCRTMSRLQVLDSTGIWVLAISTCCSCFKPYGSTSHVDGFDMQVQDATGRWIDVVMQKNEVAIFLGATSTRATGGLLKAATTRVVRFQ